MVSTQMALKRILYLAMFALLISAAPCRAVEVNVVGLFSDKALVEVDHGKPRVLSIGQSTPEGVKLIGVGAGGAVLEVEGKRRSLQLGQSISASYTAPGKPMVALVADGRGHFLTTGAINGAATQFLVDTGATSVAMSTAEARRLGVSYLNGQQGYSSTANGAVRTYRVSLSSVRVGDITLNQVEGVVLDTPGLSVTLLGMSFLSRLEMKRDGSTMTLTKQY